MLCKEEKYSRAGDMRSGIREWDGHGGHQRKQVIRIGLLEREDLSEGLMVRR